MIAGHNLLEPITPYSLGKFSGLGGPHSPVHMVKPGVMLFVMYPLFLVVKSILRPYAMGSLLLSRTKKIILKLGNFDHARILVLRGINYLYATVLPVSVLH